MNTIKFVRMVHRGEIVERVVRDSGYPITRLAEKLGKSRRHVYNIFENHKVDFETIDSIGRIINHDFSKEFKDLANTFREDREVYPARQLEEMQSLKKELNSIKAKYIELLEEYNLLLSKQVKKRKTLR